VRPNDQIHHADGPSAKLHQCLTTVRALSRALLAIAVVSAVARLAAGLARGPRWAHQGLGHDGACAHHRHERCEQCRHPHGGPREWHGHGRGEQGRHGPGHVGHDHEGHDHEGHGHEGHDGHEGPIARDARAILDERFARGEIDSAEYTERRDLLS
jgi:hypothetical protein